MRSCVLRRVLRLPHERQPRPQRRPRAPQLLQEALCTAPATRKAAAAPAATTRAAAPPGGCACHGKGSRGPSGDHARRSSSRRLCHLPRVKDAAALAATTRAAAPPGGSVYCACHAIQEALCTAPATRKAAAAPAATTRAATPYTAPATRKAAAAPAATTRAAAPPGGSVYCACHARW